MTTAIDHHAHIRRAGMAIAAALVLGCLCVGCGSGAGGGGGGTPIPECPANIGAPDELFVTTLSGNSVVGFCIDGSGQLVTPPFRVLSGQQTGLHSPMSVSVRGRGDIFVANLGDASSGPSVAQYANGADGDSAPVRTLQGGGTGLSLPNGIHVSDGLGILVSNWDSSSPPTGTVGVIEFSLDSAITQPTGGISGNLTTMAGPMSVAVDSQQRVFVAEPGSNRILGWLLRPETQLNRAPNITIAGGKTLLNQPMGVAFDGTGQIYVVNKGNSSITVYPANANGDVDAIRRIGGPGSTSTLLSSPDAIAVDRQGRIYVSQTNVILVFAAGANGPVAPLQVVRDPALSAPMGIYLH